MRSFTTLALFALSAGLAAADTTTAAVPAASGSSSGYSCAAQNILDACLTTEKPQLADCPPNDWKCLCTQSTNVNTCYNNCPGHPDQFGAQQTMTSYCNAAKAYDTSSTSSSMATSASASASAAGAATATQSSGSSPASSGASATGSSTSSSSTAQASHGAAAGLVVVETGSLLAAVVVGLGFAL